MSPRLVAPGVSSARRTFLMRPRLVAPLLESRGAWSEEW
jgi:hypothetical protein